MGDISISLDAAGAWPDLLDEAVRIGRVTRLGFLETEHGLEVFVVIATPTGHTVVGHLPWPTYYEATRWGAIGYGAPEPAGVRLADDAEEDEDG